MRSIGRGLARVEPSGILVAYAARAGQQAEDGTSGNSPFAAALAATLQEPGLEVGKLFRKVRDRVLLATNGRQEPFTYGSLPAEDYYFVTPTAGVSEQDKVPLLCRRGRRSKWPFRRQRRNQHLHRPATSSSLRRFV